MCLRCEQVEKELTDYVNAHQCSRPDDCPVPPATSNYRESVWWLTATAHAMLDVILDRMDACKGIFDKPQEISASVLSDWEAHAIRAAQALARARCTRVAQKLAEDEGDDRRVQ